MPLVDPGLQRHQLDGIDADFPEVIHHLRMGERGKRASSAPAVNPDDASKRREPAVRKSGQGQPWQPEQGVDGELQRSPSEQRTRVNSAVTAAAPDPGARQMACRFGAHKDQPAVLPDRSDDPVPGGKVHAREGRNGAGCRCPLQYRDAYRRRGSAARQPRDLRLACRIEQANSMPSACRECTAKATPPS